MGEKKISENTIRAVIVIVLILIYLLKNKMQNTAPNIKESNLSLTQLFTL
jgi:hypothetical protein